MMRHCADVSAAITKPLLGKKGWIFEKIVHHWRHLVTDEWAPHTLPLKLSIHQQGTPVTYNLTIAVSHSGIATQMPYYQSMICDRIAVLLGYPAISKLSIHQQPLLQSNSGPRVRNVTSEEKNALKESISLINNEGLRVSLSQFGHTMLARKVETRLD